MESIQLQFFEYLSYVSGNEPDFMSEVAQEAYESPSDPHRLYAYCNHLAWEKVKEKNYADATELYLESIEHNPRGLRVVFNLVEYVYLGAPDPWFSVAKAKALLTSAMELVHEDVVLSTILKHKFIEMFLAPEYWYCKECVKAKGRKLSTSERNRLNARKVCSITKAAELGFVEDDFRHYRSDIGEKIYIVKGVDDSRNAWYIVYIDPVKCGEFLKGLNDDIIHLDNHGFILKSAYGDNPPDATSVEVKRLYEGDGDAIDSYPALFCRVMLDYHNTYTSPRNASNAG
jgi:hypothetical protein